MVVVVVVVVVVAVVVTGESYLDAVVVGIGDDDIILCVEVVGRGGGAE